ncbi:MULTISPECIES: thioesterase II family protein [Thermomonospora]|uniref:Surfactin synthase thioesterase subunit n=1 Tax=Thermomonospora cellulosilytica TaxID=1411118 RepID=A0A7W3R9H5_9ACTN|nr:MULTISPECIES: alpha/beta fold hydrolase [Thermomonospora]MBA9004772.1 surfactin synthase thioesterase subunit [Thermomonospora cellulosilytica]
MSWFRCADSRPWASLRLFCFPHAGGSAVAYRSWAKEIAPAIEVHAVQYPGRADRLTEPLIDDLHRLARLIAGALAPMMDRPTALFGHSMGAIVAYETARLLEERGAPPLHLFASGARPPHRRDVDEEGRVGDADDDTLVEALTHLGGSDAEVLADPELRDFVLPYVRNDFRLIENYERRPGPNPSVPVTAVIGDHDPHVNEERAREWADATEGTFALKVFEGDHFYLVPRQSELLREIQRTLNVQ